MKLERSPEALRKEKRIADLKEQIKRTQTTLKRLKTQLTNNQARIEEIQREVFTKTQQIKERWLKVNERLAALAAKIRNDQRFSQEDKDLIEDLYRGLVVALQDEMPPMEVPDFKYDETEEKAKFRDMFQSFKVTPNPTDQREIRKVYLGLSKRFHPDRVTDEKEKEQYHQLQQQINEAYQSHDIQALLDLEALFTAPEMLQRDAEDTDVLDARTRDLENQLKLLKQQQSRLSKEIKQLRKSELGNMLTMVDRMDRFGSSLEEGLALPMMWEMIDLLERLEEALESTDRDGRLSPLLEEIQEEVMIGSSPFDLYDGLFEEDEFDGDNAPFYAWNEETPDFRPNPKPKFPVGTPVRVDRKKDLYFVDAADIEYIFDGKGLSGVVSEALLDEDEKPFYLVRLDIKSMERLPSDYVCLHGHLFNLLEIEEEKQLAVAKSSQEESEKRVYRAYREVLYRHLFFGLPKKQRKRLSNILLAIPDQNDEVNWLAYFEEQLPLPFPARVRVISQFLKAGQKVTVLRYGGYSEELYVLVLVAAGRQGEQLIPLYELEGIGTHAIDQLLDDYLIWFELIM